MRQKLQVPGPHLASLAARKVFLIFTQNHIKLWVSAPVLPFRFNGAATAWFPFFRSKQWLAQDPRSLIHWIHPGRQVSFVKNVIRMSILIFHCVLFCFQLQLNRKVGELSFFPLLMFFMFSNEPMKTKTFLSFRSIVLWWDLSLLLKGMSSFSSSAKILTYFWTNTTVKTLAGFSAKHLCRQFTTGPTLNSKLLASTVAIVWRPSRDCKSSFVGA